MKNIEMGQHLLLEVYDAEFDALDDHLFLKDLLFDGIMKCGGKDPQIIAKSVIEGLKSKKHRIRLINR